jgi:hypothetical protein
MCPEWRGSFSAFFAHVGPRPSRRHTVDRIDNEKGYEPGNVKWSTPTQQRRNSRQNHFVEFDGKRLTLVEWGEITGISRFCINHRLRRGWTVERALTEKPDGRFDGWQYRR